MPLKVKNVIYILTNPQYPGYVKIGYASDLSKRLSGLNTGSLSDFVPYAVYESSVPLADKEIHKIIDLLNPVLRAKIINGEKEKIREFFKMEPEQAFELLRHIAIVSGTENKLYRVDCYGKKIDEVPYNTEMIRKHIDCQVAGNYNYYQRPPTLTDQAKSLIMQQLYYCNNNGLEMPTVKDLKLYVHETAQISIPTVQVAIARLIEEGKIRSVGRGRRNTPVKLANRNRSKVSIG